MLSAELCMSDWVTRGSPSWTQASEKPLGPARTRNLWSHSLVPPYFPHTPFLISLLVSPPKRDEGSDSLLRAIKDRHVNPFPGSSLPRIPGGQLCSHHFLFKGPSLLGVERNNAGTWDSQGFLQPCGHVLPLSAPRLATIPYTVKQEPFINSRSPAIRSCIAVKICGWSGPTGS